MDNFANIGKAVLLQSLGLQKNYIEVAEGCVDIIDYDTPACTDCKYRALIESFTPDSSVYQAAQTICQNCPNKTITQKTVYKKIYHNEKNRYGYKPRLKSNAIKLLLLFHFYHPDRFGIIQNVHFDVLASQLNCDIKTIKNNLDVLKNYNYISYCKTSVHTINLCLCDYEQYYLPANQGGRGFFVLSKELLYQLLSIDNLLSLRIHLRELIDIDNLNAKGPFTAVSKTYKELKLALPDYCRPSTIRHAVAHTVDIFDISFHEHAVRFEIREQFNARKQKQDCFNQYLEMFHAFMKDFNETVIYINNHNVLPDKYKSFFEDCPNAEHRLLQIRDFEFEDLAQLALQYSYDYVLTAFSQIYKTYIMRERKILNLGGLIRTAINANLIAAHQAA